MSSTNSEVLTREVPYSGEGISVRALEETIATERQTQDVKVGELKRLREKNVELQATLTEEVKKLRKLSDYVSGGQLTKGFLTTLKEILSYIPGLKNLAITRRSVEELLRQQYEISALRVKEAAEFADRLGVAQQDLYDEIDRLNVKIIESAQNEELAADHLLSVKDFKEGLEAQLAEVGEETAATRELRARVDEAKRVLSHHSLQLQLYHTAEERVARLKGATEMLAETISNLRGDILQYVTAAGEKLDLVAGQIRSIGTAADASVVMLEMKKSLDVMTESMNQTTRFVTETQVYFRENLDTLLQDLEVYDDETRAALALNLELSRDIEDERVAKAVQVALEKKGQKAEGA